MSWLRLLRAELRKLTTTRLTAGFLGVLFLLGFVIGGAVVMGAGTDDAGGFIDTAQAQRSLLSFGSNAMVIGGLFGAIAVARDHVHGTVVPMLLIAPRRHLALLAQLTVLLIAGGILGLLGGSLTIAGGAIALPLVGETLRLSSDAVVQLVAAATLAGASGAIFGAGAGALLRNTGGAVLAVVLLLLIAPPLVGQLVSEIAVWMPSALVGVVAGLGGEIGLGAAIVALGAWGLVPALAGLVGTQTRDVI